MIEYIKPRPDAIDGVVSHLPSYTAATFSLGSAVLCRNNAPLIAHALALVRRGVPVAILGRDYADKLLAILDELKASSVQDLRSRLAVWSGRRSRLARSATARANIEDATRALDALCAACPTLPALRDAVDNLFVKDPRATPCVTLATGHKAKGLEWDHVFCLDRHLIPSRAAETQEELFQERNLLYVIITRARFSLTYISSNKWEPAK